MTKFSTLVCRICLSVSNFQQDSIQDLKCVGSWVGNYQDPTGRILSGSVVRSSDILLALSPGKIQ